MGPFGPPAVSKSSQKRPKPSPNDGPLYYLDHGHIEHKNIRWLPKPGCLLGAVRPMVSPTPGWSSEGQVVATRIHRVSMGDVRFLWGSILLRRGALWAPSGPKSNPKEATRPPEGDQLCHNTFIWTVVRPWTPGPRCLLDTQGPQEAQNGAPRKQNDPKRRLAVIK